MGYVSIKLPDKAKPLLHGLKLRLMKLRGKYVPDGEVIYEALRAAKTTEKAVEVGSWEAIRDYMGAFELSEEDAQEWIKKIHEERKRWRSS